MSTRRGISCRMGVSLALVLFVLGFVAGEPVLTEPAVEAEILAIQVVDNGGFEEAVPADVPGAFWLSSHGRGTSEIATELIATEQARSGMRALRIAESNHYGFQYIPALEELGDQTTISGSVLLSSRNGSAIAELKIADSRGLQVVYIFSDQPRLPADDASHLYVHVFAKKDAWQDFELDFGRDFAQCFGRNPLPRLTLTLGKRDATAAPVYWDDLEVWSSFYLLSEDALLSAILDEVRWVIDTHFAYAMDNIGVPSTHLVKQLDAVTGEVLSTVTSLGGGPVYSQILGYLACREDAAYREALITSTDELIAHVDPETRLPRRYDPVKDEYIDGNVIPSSTILFLLRVYEFTGDSTYLDAAVAMGDAILEFGPRLGSGMRTPVPIPSHYLPNTYHSATGDPVPPDRVYTLHIRWFASPGALMQLYAATGFERFREAGIASALSYINHDAVVEYWGEDYALRPFTFEPVWYSWDLLEPAFDDYFGYGIGGRDGPLALLDIYEQTEDERLRPFVDQSMTFMGATWLENIHRGGYTFADTARSWQAFYDRYVADPIAYAEYKDLLIANARNVFRSSQYGTGAWIDARFRLWDPSFPDDQASSPRNLMAALTWAYLVDDRNPEWRAMISSVFLTSVAEYKHAFGFIRDPELNMDGPNPGGFELRFFGELLNRLVPALCLATDGNPDY